MPTDQAELIKELEHRLSNIAMEWRSKPQDDLKLVEEYSSTMDQLWKLGWDGSTLSLDAQLPDGLMPKYFLEYWQRKSNE
ncbi:MAG: hypothetical protein IT314_03955 [Anaerolineales bacterium]|nr:hypothetical protein [Anaerolineales bacterium]